MTEILNQIINPEKAQQFLQQSIENQELSNAKIQIKGHELVNFGSCSYPGLDYGYVRNHNTYKQILFQTVLRARDLGCSKLDLALTAEREKKKVDARIHEMYGYSLALDHYNYAVLESVA